MPLTFTADDRLLTLAENAINAIQHTAKTGLIVSGDSFLTTQKQK